MYMNDDQLILFTFNEELINLFKENCIYKQENAFFHDSYNEGSNHCSSRVTYFFGKVAAFISCMNTQKKAFRCGNKFKIK